MLQTGSENAVNKGLKSKTRMWFKRTLLGQWLFPRVLLDEQLLPRVLPGG